MSILSFVGKLTRGLRAGESRLVRHYPEFASLPLSIDLGSSAFGEEYPIPPKYTVSAEDVSPPLAWSNLPAGTCDLSLIVEDYDISLPTPMVHLIACHLDPESGGLPEATLPSRDADGFPSAIQLGRNGLGFARYDGPAPPPGHGVHHYVFQLFAMDQRLELPGAPSRNNLVKAMKDHVLALGLLTGTFERD